MSASSGSSERHPALDASPQSTGTAPAAGVGTRRTGPALHDYDRLLRTVLEGTTDSVFVKDTAGRYLLINSAGASYIGRVPDAIINRTDGDLFPPDVAQRIAAHDHIVISSGKTQAFEVSLPVAGGTRVFLSTKTPYRDPQGNIVGLIGISRDITERNAATAALRETTQMLQALVEASPAPIIALDRNATVRMWNPAAERVFGWTATEVIGKFAPLVPPDGHDEFWKTFRRSLSGEVISNYEVRRQRKDGTPIDVSIWTSALRDATGAATGVVAVIVDLTERKQAEKALRRQHSLLRAVIEGTDDAVFLKDLELRYLVINAAGAAVIGRPPEDVIGRRDAELFPAEVAARIVQDDESILKSGAARLIEEALPLRGGPRTFLVKKNAYYDDRGRAVGLIGIARDITERKAAEQALRESEERLARILESAMDAILTLDERGVVCLFNAAAEKAFRCPAAAALGQPFARFTSASLRQALERCEAAFAGDAQKRTVWAPAGLTAVRASGEEFPIEATLSRVRTAGQWLLTLILRDVDERQQAEAELRKLHLENLYLQHEARINFSADDMIGTSEALHNVQRSIERVAGTDSTVLITGETGTGKELVARAIHSHSPRAGRVLVRVNCAALPAGLVESELFGHEKGAFTGALARKIGRFELAHGGTLFLDEIGDLPLELQAKLLRVLQEGEFERVGGTETLKSDVRLIAATHRDLEQEIAAQRFRTDLYFRLNVFPIRVPALRERPADIPLLAWYFAQQYCQKLGRRMETITRATLSALTEYHWPGNVRELENVIERAVILTRGSTLELGEWPPTRAALAPAGPSRRLADVERQHILEVLDATHWRVSGANGAAALLGLKPTTLESRMKRLGIARSRQS